MDMVAQVRQQLHIMVEGELEQYLSNFPFERAMFVSRYGLIHSPSSLISVNQSLQTDGFFAQQWPSTYLSLGRDDLGNEFFVNTTHPKSSVFVADHERNSISSHLVFQQLEPSIPHWVAKMLETERNTPDWLKSQFD